MTARTHDDARAEQIRRYRANVKLKRAGFDVPKDFALTEAERVERRSGSDEYGRPRVPKDVRPLDLAPGTCCALCSTEIAEGDLVIFHNPQGWSHTDCHVRIGNLGPGGREVIAREATP